jgi:hypothetical protein
VVRSCGRQSSVSRQHAQPAVPADRFAREIVRFLTACAVRLRRLNGNPFGVRGAWSAFLFSMVMWRTGLPEGTFRLLRRAKARGAGVVRTPGVPEAVVQVWYERPLCGLSVLDSVTPKERGSDQGSLCRVSFQMCVVPTERPLCRCGTMQEWSAHAGGNPSDRSRSAEQLVAADRFAREIVGFLTGTARACGG